MLEKGFQSYTVHENAAQGFTTNTLYNLGFEIVQFLSDSELLVHDSLNDNSIFYVHGIDSLRMKQMESEYKKYGFLMSNAFIVLRDSQDFQYRRLSDGLKVTVPSFTMYADSWSEFERKALLE